LTVHGTREIYRSIGGRADRRANRKIAKTANETLTPVGLVHGAVRTKP